MKWGQIKKNMSWTRHSWLLLILSILDLLNLVGKLLAIDVHFSVKVIIITYIH